MRTLTALLVLFSAAAAARAGDLIPTDSRFGPLRVASHRVEVTVDNQIAMTRVEQVFANDYPATLEAHYVFPVPKGASIIDFSMTVNGKLIRGELLEKDRARSIYEGIVRQAKDPGLLEHVGANLFRVRVFPILPNSQQKMEMTYVERIAYDAGSCRYVYPLLVPGSARATKADSFDLRWRLSSAVPIKDVVCATHAATVARQGEASAEVTFSGKQVDLSKDVEIGYRIERAASGMDLVAHRPSDEDGTFVLLLTPQANAPRLPKDMTFVVDTSGSMEGLRIRQAKDALRFCLSKLQPDDRFNILSFSNGVTAFSPEHVAATDEAKTRARRFVHEIDASGGTNINDALLRALEHRAPPGRPHLIVFLTDGEPTSGVTSPAAIVQNVVAANRAGVRIFAFGVGNEINRGLLDDLADATHAVTEFVSDQENIEEKVSRLQKKVSTPVISDLQIDWGQAEVSAVYPKAPGDLFAGTQLMVTGRYRKAGTFEVTLRGRAGERAVELKQQVTFPEKIDVAPAVPYLWAMRKIAALLDELRRSGQNPEMVSEVVALSKRYRIATPYTSFLVLESEAAYDQQGIERKGNAYKAPTPTAKAPTPNEPPIFFPEAKASDHNESADGEDRGRKADSRDFQSYMKGDGAGGRYGGRRSGAYDSMGPGAGGGSDRPVFRPTENASPGSLRWLARHQNPDGGWSAGDSCPAHVAAESDAHVTALSVLAFLGAGYTHLSKDQIPDPVAPGQVLKFGEAVKKGLQWLIAHQDPQGIIGERGQALAALALSEAYGMTASGALKEPAQKAIDALVATQTPGKGWPDAVTTGWAMLALKSAEVGGLTVPKPAFEGVLAGCRELAKTVATPKTPTAVSIAGWILVARNYKEPLVQEGTALLLADLPEAKEGRIDVTYWHFGTLAMFQYDGPDGPSWKKWNDPLKNALVPTERTAKDGCREGSWDPQPGTDGGRAATTALNALTLEIYYRYRRVFSPK